MSDHHHGTNGSSWIYFLGIVGAAFYYIQHATTMWGTVLGVLKALVWPAMLIYKVLELLKM
ncbi:MAG TPA: hypothetical protein VKS81_09415 [Bacteroidota bacterium]|nr:hypothetical protein [Bacteroidota bacterium]